MFSSLRTRLWLTYALLIVTALLVVAIIFLVYLLNNPLLYRQSGLKMAAVQSVLLDTQGEWSNLPPKQMQSELKRQDKQWEMRLVVLTSERQVVADSRPNAAALETRRLARLRLDQTLKDADGNAWLFKTRKLDNGYTILAAVPRPQVSVFAILTDDFLPPLWQGGALALILALALAYWMARWVADPLQRVVNAAGQFPAEGAKPLPLDGPQEVRELVNAFNQMTARVQSSQKSQKNFVANVSHELKTPLTSIQGFSQAILDGTAATPEAQKQSAQVIYNEAGRMHRMVLNLLDLARLDTGIADFQRVPLDLTALLNAVGERFGPQARSAGITLMVQADGLPSISGDGDRLAQVFTNLVENALKHTPAGGQVSLTAAQTGESVQITVADSGAGIPPEALPRIFERFYQVDSSRSGGELHGAGLGLAIAREIVRAHGGKISVRSAVGHGSVFIVQLPLVYPDAPTLVRKKK